MLALLLCSLSLFSQKNDSLSFLAPSPEFNKSRCIAVSAFQVAGYSGSLIYLNKAWYAGYAQSSFHFFNDGGEWMQADKAGHFFTSWHLAKTGAHLFEWSGLPQKKAMLWGSLSGFLFLLGVEVLDGYSSGWGFSRADLLANTLGSGLMIGQTFLTSGKSSSVFKNGIGNALFKVSFHQTSYPTLRSSLLGKTLSQQIIKDYNGQTYWLSLNLSSFMKTESRFPAWLNVAFGYGAEGMLSAREGTVLSDRGEIIHQDRYRQYYLSLDIDLTRIKTKSHFIKTLTQVFSFVKIPAPAIELSKNKIHLHPFYF